MRVTILQSVVAFGGFEQHMINLAIGLRRLGHEAEIMGLVNAGGFDQLLEYADAGLEIHYAENWPADTVPAWDLLSDLDADVVNLQMPVPQLALEMCRVPVVATTHSQFGFDSLPRCDAAVCLDQRWYGMSSSALGRMPYRLRNGIDLERFKYRRDLKKREGVACWGRFDDAKLAPARAVCDGVTVDCWGDVEQLGHANLRVMGRARPEDVCYKYRVVVGAGLCALEAMACGALLLTPEPTEERLAEWADGSFAMEHVYPPGPESEEAIRHDLASLLTISDKEAQARADFCREWVEEEHDCVGMAEGFVKVYEEVT